MKKSIFTLFVLGLIISCNKKESETTISADNTEIIASDTLANINDEHNSQNSLDWNGSYEATLPCADCTGIKTTITLIDNGTFNYVAEYLDKDYTAKDSGDIMWHSNGSVVHLKGKDINIKLKIVENGLVGLDTEGNEIDGPLKEHYNYKKLN
ncbi:copper resistance protein NlpE [Paenimyroides viscosum]|jgi:uncharacterized lipoprotein NlpE involved in copper resistance|uniref:Copper resistance protein NlpE n=1 Tax=Paenimyroides viscosum TaxID=2488729 RepID=A0A3P1B4M9_9FLAO|nr:copper resistance protein NlpE [Paenimyroides viscosum]RRA96090.1 copper resistance protein NlpE [Paenimyroides viscosum]